jgi:subfamily B ATP-binding cassette protein HlyB/CyaB
MTISVIWLGALMVFDGKISVGELVAFQMLAGRVTGPLMYMTSLIQAYQEAAVSARNMAHVTDAESEPRFTTGLRPRIEGALSFDRVTFQYDRTSEPAIADLSLSIPAGTVLGVVGRSGSGKSTLTRLVQGLLTPDSGTLQIDGHDLRELDRAHLRRSIGVVPQEAFLFRGSVRDNIPALDPAISMDEIAWAAGQAGADEFIRHLPQGYDTVLQEGAVNLSGGQKQRVAIARALLRRPPILIFDEATSALDLESEAAIHENMAKIIVGRTAIIVSHRLSSLRNADLILVLDRGRVAGFGAHNEILRSCLAYRQLWTSQTGNILRDAA